jgi:hypothetical protein
VTPNPRERLRQIVMVTEFFVSSALEADAFS